MSPSPPTPAPAELARAARAASRTLQALPSEARVAALHRVADALLARKDEILAANAEDVADARRLLAEGRLAAPLVDRLVLTERKLATLADGIRAIAAQPEPLGEVLRRTELAPGLELTQQTVALGVLLVIFESRPDALPQIAALSLRAGNGLLLKGGKEAERSNTVLHRVFTEALAPDVPAASVGLVHGRAAIADLLALDDVIDRVIPRGSASLVRHIQQHTRIPVLGHADGICHVYVDVHADPERARAIVVESKTDYPSACNAMETLLVHRQAWEAGLGPALCEDLRAAGVTLFAGPRLAAITDLPPAESLSHEYGALACAVELVDDVDGAIAHVNAHGSGHTESIVTADPATAERFLARVDAACVFHDASTRFADGYRFGLGAEVGISTARIHARGPVGVQGLLTTRWVLRGHGDLVAPFSRGERRFTHQPLD